jgi:hypothetical protein
MAQPLRASYARQRARLTQVMGVSMEGGAMTRRLLVVVGTGAALCGSAFLWVFSPRLSGLLLFLGLLVALASFSWHRRKKFVIGIWGLYLLALLLPVDIGFSPQPRYSPRLVPTLYGLPGPEAQDLAAKGEAWLGGCIVFPNSPEWMILL